MTASKRKATAKATTATTAQPDTETEWRKFLRQVEAAGNNWNMRKKRIFNRLQKTGINHADYDLPETPLELMQRFQEDLRLEVSSSLCSGEKLERLAMAWATARKDAAATSIPATDKPASGKRQTWLKQWKLKTAKWEDITITTNDAGLLVSYGGIDSELKARPIIETWVNLGISNSRERTLLEKFQLTSNEGKRVIEYDNKDVISRLRRKLREWSGIPAIKNRDPEPFIVKKEKVTRTFQMGISNTIIPNEPESEDEDAVVSESVFDKKGLHPKHGSFQIV